MAIRKMFVGAALGLGLLLCVMAENSYSQVPEPAPQLPEQPRDMPPGRGFIAPRMDLTHLSAPRESDRLATLAPPTQWDWRQQGKVTSVKNQGSCGSCYSFASLADIESQLLIDGAGTFDLSENNAKECNYYDRSCGGGNYYDMASWLSKKGVVLESCDPYVAGNVSCNSSCTYIKTLLGWNIISTGGVPSTTVLQNYIYDNGPVYTTIYTGDASDASWNSEFDSYDGSYTLYYTGTWAPNHAVLIVGWDDAFTHAGGTGGWIVKNSWGTGWGGTCGYGAEAGYFTIAYGSANIGQWSSYIDGWQDFDVNGELLYYDEGGWTGSYGFSVTTAWGMCKYVFSSTMYLSGVEFWTNDVTTDVDVYIYDDFDGSTLSNLLASKLDTSFNEAGYHSVPLLGLAPEITSGDDVYAVVKFTNASYTWPVVVDNVGSYETAKTYLSSSGSSWLDMGLNDSVDVAIRVRTSPTLATAVGDDETETPQSFHLSQNYPNPFNPVTTIDYSLSERSYVEIAIFNLLGQKVRTVVDQLKQAGQYQTEWDGRDESGQPVASGVYFSSMKTDNSVTSRKMLLLK